MRSLAEVFGVHFDHLTFDKALANKLYRFQLDYLNSNRDYLDFYSTNMLGVHRVRFKASDVKRYMMEVLEVDMEQLDKDLNDVPSVVKVNTVTSDVFNLTSIYLIHRFMNSNLLNERDKQRACYDIASLFFMRCFAALISSYFTYQSDERIVKVAYSNLSGNSLIKKLGNWYKVVDYRVNSLLDKKGIHYKTIKGLLEDRVAYVIGDSRDRIKDIIINYYREIVKVRDVGDTIGILSSLAANPEGEISLIDRTNRVEQKAVEIMNLINTTGFINTNYVYLIANMNSNTNVRTLKEVLQWIVDNHLKNHATIEKLISDISRYVNYILSSKIRNSGNKDIGKLLIEIKNICSSNKIQDNELDKLRDDVDSIIKKARKRDMNKSLAIATRTAFILYISLLIIK